MSAPSRRRVAGERKLVTMLFADLSGYTALAESLDPEEVYTFLRPTMRELQGIVESFGGSVPHIQGDGFMAVFGVPVAHEDDAERAVRAALAVRDHVRERNRGRSGIRLPDVHAGVNSGEVMVAPSDEASGYAVVGDTVNTASRIADRATAGQVLVDETTRSLTVRAIRFGPRTTFRAKGKAEPLATYRALGVVETPAPSVVATFVDREEILGVLGRELERAETDGYARVLVVTGEPGIGKSRLAAELGHSLPPDRFFVGRCTPFGDQRRLAPLADIVASAMRVDPSRGDAARGAIDRAARRIAPAGGTSVAPELRTLLLGEEREDLPRTDRDIVRAARLAIESASRGGPAAVVLDDLQWADAAIVEMLAEAERDPWPVPVLLLGLSREPVRALPALPLAALDEASMRALAEALLGGGGAAAESVWGPLARANGNALFLEEMVGMLVERGAVRLVGDTWRLADPDALEEIPTSIRLVIAARIDALPPEQKRVLHDAAVCGTVAWSGALERMGEDPAAVRRAVRGLVARGLLYERPHSGVPGTTEFAWKHALIRDVAYGELPRAARAERHLEVADWLRASSPRAREPVGAIAHHLERAWELSRGRTGPGPGEELAASAAAYLTKRGEQVFARQARSAEPLFRRALRITDASGRAADPRVVARASLGLADVLIEMGAHDEANERAGRARRLADKAGDGSLAARALLALGRSESDVGNMRRARTLLRDARERFEREGDLRGQGWALHRLSETWGWEGFDRELEDLREAYRLFARARDRFGRSVVANDLAYILSVQGGKEFHRWYGQARRLTEDEGDLRSRAQLLRTWGSYCYTAGLYEEAASTMAVCRPIAAEAGERYAEADALAIGALAIVNAGDPAVAEQLAREAVELGRELGSVRLPAMARLALARAGVRLGTPAASSRALRSARDAIRGRGLRVMNGDLAETEAMVLLDRGSWTAAGAAADELDKALGVVPMALWSPLPSLLAGRARLGACDPDGAAPHLDTAWRVARRAGATGALALATAARAQAALLRSSGEPHADVEVDDEPEVAAVLAENAGIAAWSAGDARGALRALDRAIEAWQELGATAWLARAYGMRAQVLRAGGDRARAAAASDRARTVADQVAMPSKERRSYDRPLGDL